MDVLAPASGAPVSSVWSHRAPPQSARNWPFRIAVGLSLLGNLAAVAAIGTVIRDRGGVAYLKAITTHDPLTNSDHLYAFRRGLFDISAVNARSKPIIFLGDSLTSDANWQEFFGGDAPILNRGIGGDTSVGVLRRIGQVTALRPMAVFLMIGTNDHQGIGLSPDGTARVVGEIVSTIRRDSPQTLVYLQALLPSRVPKFVEWSGQTNRLVAQLADNRSVFFLDFRGAFLEDGLLASRLTRDGIHLTPAGYQLWKTSLDPVIAELLQRRNTLPGMAPVTKRALATNRESVGDTCRNIPACAP